MNPSRIEDVDRALDDLREAVRSARGEKRNTTESVKRSWSPRRIVWRLVLSTCAVVLPFLLLVKISVSLYADYGVNAWFAIAAGAMSTVILLMVYTTMITYRVRHKIRFSGMTARSIAVLVGVYCIYSIVYISGANVKSDAVRDTYGALHPILRLAVSTLVLADGDLVVTDAEREPSDYERMGLPVNQKSLHYRQSDGFSHAVDFRTINRGAARNRIVALYFEAMGFTTIRHVGTADHLHVSLPVVE